MPVLDLARDNLPIWMATLAMACVAVLAGACTLLWPRLVGARPALVQARFLLVLLAVLGVNQCILWAFSADGWRLVLALELGAVIAIWGARHVLFRWLTTAAARTGVTLLVVGFAVLAWLACCVDQ